MLDRGFAVCGGVFLVLFMEKVRTDLRRGDEGVTFSFEKVTKENRSFADWKPQGLPASALPRRLFAGYMAKLYSVTQLLFLFLCKHLSLFIIGTMLQNSHFFEDRQAVCETFCVECGFVL
jgi:hypothetical protein